MAGESIGWGGEFFIHNGTSLTKLTTATEIGIPEEAIDEHDVTPLNASGRYKQFITGLRDAGSFDVTMNFVAGGADDVLCRAAAASGSSRAFKITFPDNTGTPARQVTGSVIVRGYKVNPLKPNEPMVAVLALRVTGATTEAAAS